MAIKLPTRIFNQIRQILNSDYMPKNEGELYFWLINTKSDEAAKWVVDNHIYAKRIFLEGIEVDNSQEQGLKDIHDIHDNNSYLGNMQD